MQRQMSKEELSAYISTIPNSSKHFQKFLHDYIIGDTFIRSCGEEDTTVWKKLKGDELEVAKNIIINELSIISDTSYIRAVGYFRDPKAIPVLERIIENLSEEFIGEKLEAGKVLYDWIGYEKYLSMLENAYKHSKGSSLDYLKVSIDWFTLGFDQQKKQYFVQMLNSNVNN